MASDSKTPATIDLNDILDLLPTSWQKQLPQWAQYGGVFIGSLAFGYQVLNEKFPDAVQSIGNGSSVYLGLAGIIAVVYGAIANRGVQKQTENATKVAALAPPVKPDGTTCPDHTVSLGLQQYCSSGDMGKAKAILDAMINYENSKTIGYGPQQGGQS